MEDGGSETKMCNNCKRDISAANFVMHEMHCRRHIVLCEHCKEPVPRSEIEQHFNDLHVTLPCEKCKQNIAKDKMEKHKSSECEKRPVPCEFCELTFPKNEFESHADFCGSRTECCPLCQQYVMLKDMSQHENSGCTYPPPKPAAPTQPAPQVSDLDPFSMLEMHQLLSGDNFGATGIFSDFSSNMRMKHERNGQYRPSLDHSESAKSNISSRVGARVAKKEPAHKKTDVNIQRANNLSSQTRSHKDFDIPPDMDYDTMLALQLAHDDWLQFDEEHTENIVPDDLTPDSFQFVDHLWDIEPAQAEQNTRKNRMSKEDNHTTIPCEFCEVEVPLETYIEHTENCPLSNTRPNNSTQQDLNNEVVTLPRASVRPSIPVINNLGTPASMQRYPHLSSDFEEFMLPCEFCEEMFPPEIIIQHQGLWQNETCTDVELFCMPEKLGIDGKDVRVIRNLYWDQAASVRIEGEHSDFRSIKRCVRQGCVIPPDLVSDPSKDV
ncbi:traf-type Zinc finger domain-containing protein 1-like protein [Plakobranchus ocellatus]|uniref:Traf-type Zinc finger domain-containing protein 1-like protein n=1 Tax=Plakobranchus ocellatus TaxID=259542 RepID=A0AAV4DBD5_9GAST|nr:traf-type Zinc finger domain-containing protein 1-like protein [Plakobranchus ocellatus]